MRFQEAQTVIQEFDANTNLKDRIGVNVALIHLYQDFLYSVRTYVPVPPSSAHVNYTLLCVAPRHEWERR